MNYDYEFQYPPCCFPGNIIEKQTDRLPFKIIPCPTIGIDVDGVIVNQIEGLLKYLNDLYRDQLRGNPLTYAEIDRWNPTLRDDLKIDVGKTIRMLQDIPGYLTSLKIFPYANDIIRSLVHTFKIVLITDRPAEHHSWTEEWMFANKIYYHSIFYTNGNPKYQTEPVNLLIEDKFEHVRDYLENTNGIAIMPIRPWNQDKHRDLQTDYPNKFYSTKGWLNTGAIIEQLRYDGRLI